MGQDKVQLTKQGLEALQEELDILKNVKRPDAVDRLATARAQGDLKENSDYHSAREDLSFLDGRIEELEEVLKTAVIVQSTTTTSSVDVGTSVKLKINDKEIEYHIVGEFEADPMQKKISHTSPLGKALVGKKPGEKVEVEAPAGKVVYEILSIK